ncbi:(1-_4)-alpha-D-glucan 1-alpha-D-glucosylmutase [Geoalkalibacter ferrihydriticus]|uniref:Maltooligosyl trehalose synthase n=2 Tax=Geoalkalibacter ferrihydriticus TaxID=392333 RepID=A0A0C2DX89_9BACT|nr:malto-oligosyltrehalose synthase [Geoalkalibacter ferrihydriticus]KIH78064.1 maltooligosyl trehalose synthase [Geoalkalibacter ferrihydriticus DSM 17813]SDM30982.1 (1->4)-alpha-D-glucan 1-alpha-D-glucosylmutase [Geoalkalibacter ferrihydriticus]
MRIPCATYRIQFTPEFTFNEARAIVAYLNELGIDTLYASPIFRARTGSTHGYDVADMNALNPELGGTDGFNLLAEEVRRHEMGWLQDIVPNHMAFDAQNPMLVDVLENGPHSRFFRTFDIDWEHPLGNLRGRVLAPFLGSFYSEALERGEIRLGYDGEGFFAGYFDQRYPLRIESYLEVLTHCHPPLRRRLGSDHPDHIQFMGVLYLLKTLATGPTRDRYEQIKFIKQALGILYQNNEIIRDQLDQTVVEFNGTAGRPESFARLDALLAQQYFRLSYWKVASEELNYRRFFSINDLISLCIEEKEVFEHCHGLVAKLVRQGHLSGLRIDHIDGLYDPPQYLERLAATAPGAYVVVEKILESGEKLPRNWQTSGTTGYDYLNAAAGLFCQTRNERRVTSIYHRFANPGGRCAELGAAKKRLIIQRHMLGDIDNLATLLKGFAGRYRYGSDLTRYALHQALIEVMVEMPVYRTYLTPQRKADEGRPYLRRALRQALRNNPGLANELGFLERVLPLEMSSELPAEERQSWQQFVMRFQQYTGPLMAKGIEDTLLYVYNRLICLNEVGGAPEDFGLAPADFHSFNQSRARHWPHTMNATATHDTKRGEDTRVRIAVISELPQEWERYLRQWNRLNAPLKKRVRRRMVPDKNDEYFLYQTLLGSYPLEKSALENYPSRIRDYAIKAVREAKVHTGWLKPDSGYEDAYLAFIDALFAKDHPFFAEFLPFQEKIAFFGMLNGLAQVLLKNTSPGVPDIYQGCEFWDLSLVDPDNRRPVDYQARHQALSALSKTASKDLPGLLRGLREDWRDGRIKLYLTWRSLQGRKERMELFRDGDYLPLEIKGIGAQSLLAYARRLGDQTALVVVPRLLTELVETGTWPLGEDVWGDTEILLPEGMQGPWRDSLSGRELEGAGSLNAGRLLQDLPLALLFNDGP